MENPVLPLFRAPHRSFFLLGMAHMLLAMGWWLYALVLPMPVLMPASWLHGYLMIFGLLAPFMVGFLFTAYSRWLGADGPSGAWWKSTLATMVAGLAGIWLGAFLSLQLALLGAVLLGVSWALVLGHLIRARLAGNGAALHANCMIMAVSFGLLSIALLALWLWRNDARYAVASLAVGMWGFLLPVYLVVAHRMLPFFAGCILKPYSAWRPAWALLTLLGLTYLHLALMLAHKPQWLWAGDGLLAALSLLLAWRWQWWRAWPNKLLSALFIAWGGLIAGISASAIQSLGLALTGTLTGAKAPHHLIAIGFCTAMLIAMATRVTLGHSGRPLQMNAPAWWALLGILLAAALRVLAELVEGRQALLVASAVLWLLCSLLWVLKHAPMLIKARADQADG